MKQQMGCVLEDSSHLCDDESWAEHVRPCPKVGRGVPIMGQLQLGSEQRVSTT